MFIINYKMTDKKCTYETILDFEIQYKKLEQLVMRMKESMECMEDTMEKLSEKCYIMNHKLTEYKCRLEYIENKWIRL